MTVLTLFDSDRARDAVLSDAAQWVCCACAALHARRCLRGAERLWGGEKAPDGVHGSRCEETPFTLHAMNGARLADSRHGVHGAYAAAAALYAALFPRGAQRR